MIIEGAGLTPFEVVAAARAGVSPTDLAVTVSPAARERARASFEFATEVAERRPLYGRSTGVGANRGVPVTAADGDAQAERLLRSHATTAGPTRAPERVRAMLIIRLNQLAAGGSGINPDVLDALAAMITHDALPPVREWGSIGTGDLSALAVTALCLRGERAPSSPLPEPVAFTAGDALPFLSSNAATLADAALALVDLRHLAESSLGVAALTFRGVRGNAEAYSVAVESVTPFPGARRVCRRMRELLSSPGSSAGPSPGSPSGMPVPARIQDPFGLRTLPQVHGALFDALDTLDATVTALINAPAENPVFLPGAGDVAHHGGFHVETLAQHLHAVLAATARSAELARARLALLVEPAFTGLTPFLSDTPPGSSGVMIVEYVLASALGSLRALAQPAAASTITLSRGTEDDAGFAAQAARQAMAAVKVYRTVLAGELVAAIRCVRMTEPADGADPVGPDLAALITACETLPHDVADRDLTDDLDRAELVLGRSLVANLPRPDGLIAKQRWAK